MFPSLNSLIFTSSRHESIVIYPTYSRKVYFVPACLQGCLTLIVDVKEPATHRVQDAFHFSEITIQLFGDAQSVSYQTDLIKQNERVILT